MNCDEAMEHLHSMWHDLTDRQHVCAESAYLHIPDTEPEITIIVMMAAVERKDCERIRTIAQHAISNAMIEVYGPVVESNVKENKV